VLIGDSFSSLRQLAQAAGPEALKNA